MQARPTATNQPVCETSAHQYRVCPVDRPERRRCGGQGIADRTARLRIRHLYPWWRTPSSIDRVFRMRLVSGIEEDVRYMARRESSFNVQTFFGATAVPTTVVEHTAAEILFAQGDRDDRVMYLQ